MILETLVGKMIDEAWELIKTGYKKIDQYNDFTDVYDHAFGEYQKKFGEDPFYQTFFVEGLERRKEIRKLFDRDILTRELPNEIMSTITEELGEEQTGETTGQIHWFIATLFSELLCVGSYRERIAEYRRDAESSETRDNTRSMLGLLQPDIYELCRKSCRRSAKKYTEKLFLEDRDDPDAKTVKDVYVEPSFKLYGGHERTRSEQNVREFISDFLRKDAFRGNQILLILANAGMGKSTLLSKLCYEYVYQNGEIDGHEKVLSIKLSDYDSDSKDPLKAICTELKIGDVEELDGSLLLMDAYDELQKTSRGVNEFYENFIDRVTEVGCKVIMTSRLNYFDLDAMDSRRGGVTVIELLPFGPGQRSAWLDLYGKATPNDDYLRSELKTDEKIGELLGIPIVLYFIAHDNIEIQFTHSKYALYEKVFGMKAIKHRRYSSSSHHAMRDNAEGLYKLMQDMSLYVFHRDENLIVDRDDFIDAITNKNKEKWEKEDVKDLETLKRYCGIVSYFNSKGDGVFEYVHKSIYEFYLSMKIYGEIKSVFQAYDKNKDNISEHISNISHLLLRAKLTDQTLEFIFEHMEADKSELSQIVTSATNFVYKFLRLGPTMMHEEGPDFLTQIKNVFFNVWRIYNRLITLTDKSQLASWFDDENKRQLLIEFLNLSRYEGLELKTINLRDAKLSGANLSGADLRGAHLDRADLRGANLSGADLRCTHLVRADLRDTDLKSADLKGADLREADLSGVNLIDIHIFKGEYLRGAHLDRDDIIGAHYSYDAQFYAAKFSTNMKTKITLEQLSYFLNQGADHNCFEVYKNASNDTLATPDEFENIIEGIVEGIKHKYKYSKRYK